MKKIEKFKLVLYLPEIKNLQLNIKLIYSLLLVVSIIPLHVNESYSQTAKVTTKAKHATIKDILNEIESNTEFIFFYYDSIIDLNRNVNITSTNQSVDKLLDKLFESSDNYYEIIDRQIVITKKFPLVISPLVNNDFRPLFRTLKQPQTKEITGTVLDKSGQPLTGVSIVIKGTTTGTITDIKGYFRLEVPLDAKILVFSYIGLKTQEVDIKEQTKINIIMEEEMVGFEELIIVGYGTQKKESVVGSITQINTESLTRSGVTNVTAAITGKLSGVLTIQEKGQPGDNYSEIVIRGLSSWGGSQPLILVDGVEREFRDLDPNEINTISVLKDASATAVFGAKGANGVILVTTRRGVLGKPVLNFSGQIGLDNPTRIPKHIDAHTTLTMLNVAYMNEKKFEDLIPQWQIEEHVNPSSRINSILYPDVNWWNIMTKKVTPTSSANINIRGGTDFVKYFASLGHTYESDLFKNKNIGYLDSRHWYHRLNYRTNLDFNLTSNTLFSFNVGGDIGLQNIPTGFRWRDTYRAATVRFPAYFPQWFIEEVPDLYYPDAAEDIRLAAAFGGSSNPYSALYNASFNRYLASKLFTDAILEQKLDFITKGLSIRGKVSYNTYFRNNSLRATYNYREWELNPGLIGTNINPWSVPGATQEVYIYPPPQISVGSLMSDYYRDLYYETGLSFSRGFVNHHTTILLLGNRQEKNRATDFPYYNQGLIGRLTYDYKLKYLLETNLSYTGSERFAPGNRYGFFPSLAIGYVISEEDFFKNALPWINKLKFRYSDGKVGSDFAVDRWLYISDFYIREAAGIDYASQPRQTVIYEEKGANLFAQWEESRKKNLGIELGIFNNLFNINIDIFDEKREKMMLEPRSLTFFVGTEFKELNLGKAKKHGFEIEAEFNKTTLVNFNYFLRTQFGWNENRVVFKDDLPHLRDYLKSAGKPIDINPNGVLLTGSGYFTTVDDIHNNPAPLDVPNLVVGDCKYLDYNVDGIISREDKFPAEGSYYAPIIYSFTPGFSYKGFYFHLLFQGNEGKWVKYDLSFENEFQRGIYKVNLSQVDYWRPDNPNANHATLHYDAAMGVNNYMWAGGSGDSGYDMALPGRFWRDASYLRLKEIYLGYTFKPGFLEDFAGITNVKAYLSGYDLYTWTKLIQGDPEVKEFWHGFYPVMRRFNLGLSFSF